MIQQTVVITLKGFNVGHFSAHRFIARLVVLSQLIIISLTVCSSAYADEQGPERWEAAIRKFEEQDQQSPPKRGGVLFIGSSSIRMWKLEESFGREDYINRGFGGSEIADSTHFAHRIVFPYHPRIIVMYAGDNDIAKGKSPEQVANDFRSFEKTIHASLTNTRIIYVAIKPSLARWKLYEKMRDANRRIRSMTEKDERLEFVDLEPEMLDADKGTPRPELFADDGLHLSAAGYVIWTRLVLDYLSER